MLRLANLAFAWWGGLYGAYKGTVAAFSPHYAHATSNGPAPMEWSPAIAAVLLGVSALFLSAPVLLTLRKRGYYIGFSACLAAASFITGFSFGVVFIIPAMVLLLAGVLSWLLPRRWAA